MLTLWPRPELFTAFLEVAETVNSPPVDARRPRGQRTSEKNGSGVVVEITFITDTSNFFVILQFS